MGLAKYVPVLLLALPSSNEAFSSSMTMARRQQLPSYASTIESVAEAHHESSADNADAAAGVIERLPDLSSPISESPTHSIQSRTFDTNIIINTSIFLFALGIVLERVLSVDVGITRGCTPIEIVERIPLDIWRSYTNILEIAPVQTKAVTSATVYTIGDILAQRQEGNEIGKMDRWRIGRSLAAGLIGHGPMSHVWYQVSEDFFDNVLQLHAWWDFIPKVIVDQAVFGPIWNNSYIILLGLMQFQKPSQIWADMKRTTVPLIISGLKLWPFVHCVTYGLIPVENRLLWVDAVEIVWVTILAREAASASDGNLDDEDGVVSSATTESIEALAIDLR